MLLRELKAAPHEASYSVQGVQRLRIFRGDDLDAAGHRLRLLILATKLLKRRGAGLFTTERLEMLESTVAASLPFLSISGKLRHGIGICLSGISGHDNAARPSEIGQATGIGHDGASPGGARFHHDIGRGIFVLRGRYQGYRPLQPRRNFVMCNPATESNTFSDAEFACQFPATLHGVSIPNYLQMRIDASATQRRQRADRDIRSFARLDVSDKNKPISVRPFIRLPRLCRRWIQRSENICRRKMNAARESSAAHEAKMGNTRQRHATNRPANSLTHFAKPLIQRQPCPVIPVVPHLFQKSASQSARRRRAKKQVIPRWIVILKRDPLSVKHRCQCEKTVMRVEVHQICPAHRAHDFIPTQTSRAQHFDSMAALDENLAEPLAIRFHAADLVGTTGIL